MANINIEKLLTGATIICGLIASIYGGYNWFYAKAHEHDIKGQWKFTFLIESSSMKRYVGMSSGFKIFINENGEKIDGKGQKWWVNNEIIPYSEHDRIEVMGCSNDGMVKVNYTLFGKLGNTVGGFDVKIKNDTLMEGTFIGTAADTKGTVKAIRLY